MRLVCISDTHGDHEGLFLPSGDVLIHAGDLSAHGTGGEVLAFMRWLGRQPFRHRVCIAGNHDLFMEEKPEQVARFAEDNGVILLNDSGQSIDGVQFWGSPITPRFFDWAFMRDPGEPIDYHWRQIPETVQVLITHGPPFGILDQIEREDGTREKTGCPDLLRRVRAVAPALHVFGHIHEGHGIETADGVTYLNVSTMDEHYRRAHPPVVFDIEV